MEVLIPLFLNVVMNLFLKKKSCCLRVSQPALKVYTRQRQSGQGLLGAGFTSKTQDSLNKKSVMDCLQMV